MKMKSVYVNVLIVLANSKVCLSYIQNAGNPYFSSPNVQSNNQDYYSSYDQSQGEPNTYEDYYVDSESQYTENQPYYSDSIYQEYVDENKLIANKESTGSLIKAVSLPIIRLLDALSGEKKSRRTAETDRLTTADERFLDEQLGFVTTAIGDIITQIGFGKQGIFRAIEGFLPMQVRALLDRNIKRTAANWFEYMRIAMQGYINIVRQVRDIFRIFYYFGEFIDDPANFDVFKTFTVLGYNNLINSR